MSDAFKPTKIGLFGVCPEIAQGTPNWDLVSDGGSNSTTAITVDTTSGSQHNNALAAMVAGDLDYLTVYFRPDTTTTALQGKSYNATTTSIAAGVATINTETMDDTPVATDRFVLYAPIKASEVNVSPGYENLARPEFERQTLDMATSNKGLKQVSGSFNWEPCGLEQELGDGDTPRIDRLGQLLRSVGSRRAVAGTTVSGSGSTTTVIDVSDASNMEVGDWVMIGGEAARVTAINVAATPDNITVSPALSSAPADTTEVFMGEVITPADAGHLSHTVLFARDTQLVEANGCVFSFGVSGTFGQNMEGSAEWDGEDWDMQDTYLLDGRQSSKVGIPIVGGRAFFGTTEICVNSFEFTLGHGRQLYRDYCVGQRQFITSRDAQINVTFRNQSAVPKETWEANGTHDWLFVQSGITPGGTFVIAGKAQIQDPISMSDVEGMTGWDASFAFRDDQSESTAVKPLLIRF